MSNYSCLRCDEYSTDKYFNIARHVRNSNDKCIKHKDSYKYSEDYLLILTILNKNSCVFSDKELEKVNSSNILYKNKIKVLDLFNEININSIKTCTHCSKTFPKIDDLKKHLLLNCYYDNLVLKENVTSNVEINGNNNINTNVEINGNNNNLTNNFFNINLDVKPPIPFEQKWDLSEISEEKRGFLLLNKMVYTNFLSIILENKRNLNVIIDDINSKNGIVYNNENYKNVSTDDIVDSTIDKLKNHLIDISTVLFNDSNMDDETKIFLNKNASRIRKKHIDYKLNTNNIKEHVKTSIKQVYLEKSKEAIDIYKKVNDDKPLF